jgi:hypothetical protein
MVGRNLLPLLKLSPMADALHIHRHLERAVEYSALQRIRQPQGPKLVRLAQHHGNLGCSTPACLQPDGAEVASKSARRADCGAQAAMETPRLIDLGRRAVEMDGLQGTGRLDKTASATAAFFWVKFHIQVHPVPNLAIVCLSDDLA